MGGGVFQIKAKGLQDKKLTGDPSINFLKQEYKPYVNFSIEQTRLESRDVINFGKRFTITFKNTADLLHKLYFCFTLPALTPTSGTYSGWTNSLGHALIDNVEISVGGITLSRMYGIFMEIWNELTVKQNPYSAYDSMIGKYRHMPLLETNAEDISSYMVPLPFWFCNHVSSSFPLITMYHSELRINFTLRPFEECIVYDGLTPPAEVNITDGYVLAEYVYLEDAERTRMRNNPANYLISQCQNIDAQSMPLSGTAHLDVTFNHPVYELFFVIRETESDNNNDWFNFSIRNNVINTPIEQFISTARLLLDATERTQELVTDVFSRLNSSRYHSNCTDKHIYTMPFCDEPENPIKPTGSLNFSVIDQSTLVLKIKNTIPASYLYAYALNWNWIKIENGILSLEFIS